MLAKLLGCGLVTGRKRPLDAPYRYNGQRRCSYLELETLRLDIELEVQGTCSSTDVAPPANTRAAYGFGADSLRRIGAYAVIFLMFFAVCGVLAVRYSLLGNAAHHVARHDTLLRGSDLQRKALVSTSGSMSTASASDSADADFGRVESARRPAATLPSSSEMPLQHARTEPVLESASQEAIVTTKSFTPFYLSSIPQSAKGRVSNVERESTTTVTSIVPDTTTSLDTATTTTQPLTSVMDTGHQIPENENHAVQTIPHHDFEDDITGGAQAARTRHDWKQAAIEEAARLKLDLAKAQRILDSRSATKRTSQVGSK